MFEHGQEAKSEKKSNRTKLPNICYKDKAQEKILGIQTTRWIVSHIR
jgi:hypothetical protein